MDRVTRFSLRNPTVIVVAVIMALLGGLYTAGQMKRETMPDVSIPIVAVITPYPGAAPEDVYEQVTKPMEQAVSGVEGLDTLQSTSADSVSVVVAQFSYSADIDEAEREIADLMSSVELPENALEPDTARITFGSAPILKMAVHGGEDPEVLRSYVRETVVPRLESVDGVGAVRTSDEGDRVIMIDFDQEALDEHGLSAEDVIQQLQAAKISFPVGSIVSGDIEEPVRVSGDISSIEDIEDMTVVVYPDMNTVFGDALASIGEGMGELGAAVGEMGGALGELGSAVGQLGEAVGEMGAALGEMGGGLGEQIGLVAALQDTQAQLLDAKIGLSQAQMVLLDPTATPEEIAQAQATIAQLQATIPALEAAVAGIQQQLAAAQQEALAQQSAGSSFEMPSGAPSGLEMPSGSAAEVGTVEPEEPELELVRLGDLADVSLELESGVPMARRNGEPAVLIDIVKSQDANTVTVSDDVQAALAELDDQAPEDVSTNITYDAADMINSSIADMVREGLMGAVFAFLVILVFLRDWRATIISAVSIPLSVITAVLLVGQFDITLNVMTLGGLTVAIGRVVDDSIVVIENIYRHLQIGDERDPEMVRQATREVSSAITSSTLTTVAVFAPMAFVSGIVGKVFTPFAWTVALALLASLLTAVTVVPLIAKWVLLKHEVPKRDEEEARQKGLYPRLLRWALDHKKSVMATAALLFVGSLALVGVGFMPPSTERFVTVDVEMPAGTTPEAVDDFLSKVETVVAGTEGVVYYQSQVGAESGYSVASSTNRGLVFMEFDEETDLDAFVEGLRDRLEPLADDARISVARTNTTGAGANSVDLIVTGPDFDDIAGATAAIEHAIQDVDGIGNVTSNLSESRPQIVVDVDQDKAAENGLNAAMVAGVVRGLVAEQDAGSVTMDGEDLTLRYSVDSTVTSAQDIRGWEMSVPMGDPVRIGDIARVEETATPVSVLTRDEHKFAAVSATVTDRDSGKAIREIQSRIDSLSLPDGVEVEVAGMAEMMNESFQQLGLAMVIAVFAVYLVMVIAFGEAIAPLAIMGSLPLATIGGVIALFAAGIPLDMPAMIGALMLIGIVTTNAIVLIDRVQQKRAEGLSRRDALMVAGTDRIRPVLMTALTTIIALAPMALGIAEGALMSQSLAVVAMGGLISSTVLTLVVVPVVYDFLEGLKDRVLGLADGS
ncbi:MAG: efflux RND transporter permease subunit [Coriobacteriia bacterium]